MPGGCGCASTSDAGFGAVAVPLSTDCAVTCTNENEFRAVFSTSSDRIIFFAPDDLVVSSAVQGSWGACLFGRSCPGYEDHFHVLRNESERNCLPQLSERCFSGRWLSTYEFVGCAPCPFADGELAPAEGSYARESPIPWIEPLRTLYVIECTFS